MPFSRMLALLIALFFVVIYIVFPDFAYSEVGDALVNKAIIAFVLVMGYIFISKILTGTFNEDECASYSPAGKFFGFIAILIVVAAFFHFLLRVDPLGVM